MNPPRHTEPQANGALAQALMKRHPLWDETTIHTEQTRVLREGSGRRVDILIHTPGRQPVAVETEFAPAVTVENDAMGRLGWKLESTGDTIESAISVVLPEELTTGSLSAIETCKLHYATHHLHPGDRRSRWPESGRLDGSADDLADAIEALSLSQQMLEQGVRRLEETVKACAGLLSQQSTEHVQKRLAEKLKQSSEKKTREQTLRMVAAILTSAFVFHASVEGQPNIPSMASLRGNGMHRHRLLVVWEEILQVNYWPIFSIAKSLLEEIQTPLVPHLMERLLDTASSLASLGTTTYHDLMGRMFQALIADRKLLATFYTLPSSATLLSELAVERLPVDWSTKDSIEALRIADFACGTGALLSAVQRAIYRRYRRAGGNDLDLHRVLVERTMIGMDIMPAATHLTCSMLSSSHPGEEFGKTNIHTMPYGKDGGKTHIGSLDLLDAEQAYSLFAAGAESMAGQQADLSDLYSVKVNDKSCDLVVMNPPFTRPTGHEGKKLGIPVPSFAGFSTSKDEQRAMSKKLKKIRAAFGDGNAGLASNFMDLAHRKLNDGGVLALVLPFTFNNGKSWEKARQMLDRHYSDIHVASIATTGTTARAFSADTGMAECLVLATKRPDRNGNGPKVTSFSNLDRRPRSLLEAQVVAKGLRIAKDKVRHRAASTCTFGATAHRDRSSTIAGSIYGGGAAGVRDSTISPVAQALNEGRLLLPRQEQAFEISLVPLKEVADRGLYHMDINGTPPRGAFDIRKPYDGEFPTYPVLWAHDADRERQLVVNPDRCGDVRPGCREKALVRWRQASQLHANLDFRLNSQSLALCRTPEKCLGGTAWPNIIPRNKRYEIPLLLWGNSTLGLLMHWWNGTRQQSGRSRVKITVLPDLLVLDPRTLTDEEMTYCQDIYSRFKGREFLPANEAYRDNTRRELDHDLLFGRFSVLKLDPDLEDSLDLLRRQWCAEPSVHGGKHTQPSRQ